MGETKVFLLSATACCSALLTFFAKAAPVLAATLPLIQWLSALIALASGIVALVLGIKKLRSSGKRSRNG